MPHFPKPFFRPRRGLWYVQLHGKQHNLGSDADAAMRQYHELMRRPPPIASEMVVGIIEAFLEWSQQHRSSETYQWYRKRLESFVASLDQPLKMTVEQLKPYLVQQWADSHKAWGKSQRRGAITAVQRAFLWAEKMGHITKSPIRHIEKPPAERRETLVTESHYQAMLVLTRDRQFRDILEFAWETGARPQEIRILQARHYDAERNRFKIPPEEAKGKKRWRIIYLSEKAKALVSRLTKQHPNGMLFRNVRDQPWKVFAFGCRFARLSLKVGKRYCLYDFRHTFANRMLTSGLDTLTVASLLGHADGTMLAKVYSHLGQSTDYLRQELMKASVVNA